MIVVLLCIIDNVECAVVRDERICRYLDVLIGRELFTRNRDSRIMYKLSIIIYHLHTPFE